jgi:RNA-directed DNA polymerase
VEEESTQRVERFQIDLKERLAKVALSLHPEKTRLIDFGRYAAGRRRAGPGQAGDVRFPGANAYCSTRKDGAG